MKKDWEEELLNDEKLLMNYARVAVNRAIVSDNDYLQNKAFNDVNNLHSLDKYVLLHWALKELRYLGLYFD